MLYYSSIVGATVKTHKLMIWSILGNENYKTSPCSAELNLYKPSCVAGGDLQNSTNITGKI